MNGLPVQRAQSTPGRSDPPVKPTSEVAHQPSQQPAAARMADHGREPPGVIGKAVPQLGGEGAGSLRWSWLCGGVQRGEIKSAERQRWRPRRDAPGKPLRRARFDQVTKRRVAPSGPLVGPSAAGVTRHPAQTVIWSYGR